MVNQSTTNFGVEAIYPTARFGLGTTGGELATLSRDRQVERLLDKAGLAGEWRARVRGMLLHVLPVLVLDSGIAKRRELQPAFAGDEAELVQFPAAYQRIASPGGHDLFAHIDEEPNRHMKEFLSENEELFQSKSANAEAQSNRVFGAVNVYADILRIDRQLQLQLRNLRDLPNTHAWEALIQMGFPLTAATTFLEVGGSGAGGQATALFVIALALLNLRLPLARSGYKVVVDFLAPGFLSVPHEAVAADQLVKTLRVLNDLAALKAGETLSIPHPQGPLVFGGARARDIYDELYLHLPRPSTVDAAGSFLSAAANLIVDRSLGPYANDWRTSVSNDPYLASVPELLELNLFAGRNEA